MGTLTAADAYQLVRDMGAPGLRQALKEATSEQVLKATGDNASQHWKRAYQIERHTKRVAEIERELHGIARDIGRANPTFAWKGPLVVRTKEEEEADDRKHPPMNDPVGVMPSGPYSLGPRAPYCCCRGAGPWGGQCA